MAGQDATNPHRSNLANHNQASVKSRHNMLTRFFGDQPLLTNGWVGQWGWGVCFIKTQARHRHMLLSTSHY